MGPANETVLDKLLEEHAFTCRLEPVKITPDEIVHVVGSQEPVREQPDDRTRLMLNAGWLTASYVHVDPPEAESSKRVTDLQQAARARLKQTDQTPEERDQIRWVVEKTRSRESKQQIAQRVWLAIVVYSLGYRGLAFDDEAQVCWNGGQSGRIGIAPDDVLDRAWKQTKHEIYTASFRGPDGTIMRGKGRHRWHIYHLKIDERAETLFKKREHLVRERVALIVASEAYATQPQLPRDFYGGDAFQQACIDAQDQQFAHILVLSPEHGVMSLDDTVPSDQSWEDMLQRRVWLWQTRTALRIGWYLLGEPDVPQSKNSNWWSWLNPESVYELSIFGGGFAIHLLLEHLLNSSQRAPDRWPHIVVTERRPGYQAGEFDEDYDLMMDDEDDSDLESEFDDIMQDIDHLMELATEFATLVNVYVPPTGEFWELAPDEALLPVRLLLNSSMDINDLLDLLADMSLLLERPVPVSLLLSANMVVSMLLQITHSLVHDEISPVHEVIESLPESILQQYVERALQETDKEERLCACLTLAEQMQLIALSIPMNVNDQLLTWMQTYLSGRMRQRILGNLNDT